MRIAIKLSLVMLSITVLVLIAAIFGMPGARDGELHLKGDYYFTHSGGVQSSITEERDGYSALVIHMKVEEFIVHGDEIYISRRPVFVFKRPENGSDFRLSDSCEYYRIDVTGRVVHGPFALGEVKNRTEWAFLKAGRMPSDFGPTLCKLAAVSK